MQRAGAGYISLVVLAVGAGAGNGLAYAVGAFQTPFALLGAVGGYLLAGVILRRICSRVE
jgi:hypothetical protein